MNKGIKNSLLNVGLAGILAMTGCQNTKNWSVPNKRGTSTYETRPQVYNSTTLQLFEENRISYPTLNTLEIPVKENRTDYIQDVTTKTTPIMQENWTAQQIPVHPLNDVLFPYLLRSTFLLGIPIIQDLFFMSQGDKESAELYKLSKVRTNRIIPNTTRLVGSPTTTYETSSTKGNPYTKKSSEPARNVPIEVASKAFRVDGEKPPVTKRTNMSGVLKTSISPVDGYLNQKDAEDYSRGILTETYKPQKLEELLSSEIPLSRSERQAVTFKTKTNELKLDYLVYFPVDNKSRINQKIKRRLEDYLAGKFPMKEIPIEVIQKDDEIPLKDVKVTSTRISGPTEKMVLSEEEKFLKDFLFYPADVKALMVSPAPYISTFPESFVINEKITATINEDCVIGMKLIHPGHYAQNIEITVKDTNGKVIVMPRLGDIVEQREAPVDATKGSVNEIR